MNKHLHLLLQLGFLSLLLGALCHTGRLNAQEGEDGKLTPLPFSSVTPPNTSGAWDAAIGPMAGNGDAIITIAHHYTAADLVAFEGKTIVEIEFFPAASQENCTYTIYAWPDKNRSTVLMEQPVNAWVQNEPCRVALDIPFAIKEGQDLWIGVVGNCKDGPVFGKDTATEPFRDEYSNLFQWDQMGVEFTTLKAAYYSGANIYLKEFVGEAEEYTKYFDVTVQEPQNGSIKVTGHDDLSAVPAGTKLFVEATPEDGFRLESLTANGVSIMGLMSFVVKANTTVEATFSPVPVGGYLISFTTTMPVGGKLGMSIKTADGAVPVLKGISGVFQNGQEVFYTIENQFVSIEGNVSQLIIGSENGINTFDATDCQSLRELIINGNAVQSMNLSGCSSLMSVAAARNQMKSINLSGCIALQHLFVNENNLTELDLTDCTKLYQLKCNNNLLETLDVTHAPYLTSILASNNALTALNLKENSELAALYCDGNKIGLEAMHNLVNSIADRNGRAAGYIIYYNQANADEGNRILVGDVEMLGYKNWKAEAGAEYPGQEPVPVKVTLTAGANGTITAAGNLDLNAVPQGTKVNIEATPAQGFVLSKLTANGVDILEAMAYTVFEDTEIVAEFAQDNAVADVNVAPEVRLYPNPARDYVVLSGAQAGTTARLYTLSGAQVATALVSAAGEARFDTAQLPAGKYLLFTGSAYLPVVIL